MCERYGVRNSVMIPEVRQKIKGTLLEHYGVEHQMYCQEVKDKIKTTCIERYGVTSVGLVQEFIEKKYQTNRERYGVDMPLQNKDIREKASNTLEKRYDVRYALQSKEIREKCHNSLIEHIKSDKEWLMDLVKRIHNSKKENESYGKSKEEDYIFELLCNKFDKSDIYRQYDSDERYPFACDFYIKSLDMFIEYNGFWSHGQHPFLEDNIDDIEKLKLWDSRSEKKIYINAIKVWVIRDPLKRKTAKENNLNYVELWTIKEAKSFI